MKPSRDIRNVVLGLYHDLSMGEIPEGIAESSDAILIGTGPEEFYQGANLIRAALRAQTELVGTVKVIPGNLQAFEEGTVGWASDWPTLVLSDGRSTRARHTFVFHRKAGEWKLLQFHGSHGVEDIEFWGVGNIPMDMIAKFVETDRPDLAPVMSPEGTVTIVFTDIEASTATNEKLGDDRFMPLLFEHNDIVQTHTNDCGGSLVKSQGDGYMLAFPSARRAVEAAIDIQRAVDGLDEPIGVRMGIHTGEPARRADDFFGRDVAYAARLGAAAVGGEILVSSLVKSLVEPSGAVKFDGPHDLELKGFHGTQPVYRVVWQA
jgi:class 3 adenylate cyclase